MPRMVICLKKKTASTMSKTREFNSDPDTTTVTFCHASIGDLFRDKNEKVSAGLGHPALGVKIAEAQFLVLKSCLDMICDQQRFSDLQNGETPVTYALGQWDDTVLHTWVQFNFERLISVDALQPIANWLNDEVFLTTLSHEDRKWVESVTESPAKLLIPASNHASRQWLNQPHDYWLSPKVCLFLVIQISYLLQGRSPTALPEMLSSEDIVNVAESTGLEKTAEWHRGVAHCLREYGHLQKAKEHFEVALELEPRMFRARRGLALNYVGEGHYDSAVSLYVEVINTIEKLLSEGKGTDVSEPDYADIDTLADCYQDMAYIFHRVGDKYTANLHFAQAFDLCNDRYDILLYILQSMWSLGNPILSASFRYFSRVRWSTALSS
ncbi:hypothetical protein AJ79_06948 [Helicocarpus griseus UAMH5409]|uniref:Uncharacterized protein n=1 Tax=Helicocarpus griseus UAMH5409 TaxID=1447875 RepID=A0A2B7X7V7_9EURO|nr:hypothetical protein AJ79_06948 [Helicocarpus griseus UAMH5409]